MCMCVKYSGTLFPYAILEPFVIYYTLLQDSKWWQGMDIMQGRRVLAAEEIRSPLAGLDLSINSAQSLAASMDRMGQGRQRHHFICCTVGCTSRDCSVFLQVLCPRAASQCAC